MPLQLRLYPVEQVFSHLKSSCYAPRLKKDSSQYDLAWTSSDLEEIVI